jgi:hypothetical protein
LAMPLRMTAMCWPVWLRRGDLTIYLRISEVVCAAMGYRFLVTGHLFFVIGRIC